MRAPASLARAAARAGERGFALLACAAIDLAYGTGLLAGHTPALTHAVLILPVRAWGWIWVITGVLLLTGVPLKGGDDAWHYALAVALKCTWGALILSYWAEHGDPGGWASAAPWLGLAAILLLIAGWQD